MNKNLLAFFLSCLTASLIWSAYCYVTDPTGDASQIRVIAPSDDPAAADAKIAAIENLHLANTNVVKFPVPTHTLKNEIFGWLFIALLNAIIVGVSLFFYKLYCRWLGATPTV